MKHISTTFLSVPYICALVLWSLIAIPIFSRSIMNRELSGEELWQLSKRVAVGEQSYTRAKAYGEGGLHYLGHLLLKQEAEEIAKQVFSESFQKEVSPWKELSLRDLGWMLMNEEKWEELLELMKEAPLQYRDMRFLHLSALYRLQHYRRLKRFLREMPDLLPLTWNRISEEEFLFESRIWQTIMQYEEEDELWIHSLQQIVDEWEASYYHTRLHVYFSQQDTPNTFLVNKVLRLLEAKHLQYSKGGAEAYMAFTFDDGLPPDFSSVLIRDLYHAAVDSQQFTAGAQWLLHNEFRDKGSSLEYAGRLLYRAEEYRASLNALEQSLQDGTAQDYKRRRWYWFRTLVQQSSREAVTRFSDIMPIWRQDPFYFDDVLDSLLARLVSRQAWDEVLQIFRYIRERPNVARAAYATVLFLARGDRALLEVAYDQEESLSFHAIAAELLNRPVRLPIHADERLVLVEEESLPRTFVQQYLDVRLPSLATEVFREQARKVSISTALEMADMLALAGKFDVTVRHLPSPEKSEALMRRYYPFAFAQTVELIAEEHNIPPELVYALMREESRFAANVHSVAGAVGLMQLLPSTAFQMADELNQRIETLEDPETNIRLGSYYLRRMLQQFSSPAQAIAAYNAGPSRLSQWLMNTSRRGVMFSMMIPFRETRRHVFKVFDSLLWYQAFSGKQSVAELVTWYFGNEH